MTNQAKARLTWQDIKLPKLSEHGLEAIKAGKLALLTGDGRRFELTEHEVDKILKYIEKRGRDGRNT